jgi:IS605 OrfB family transposase
VSTPAGCSFRWPRSSSWSPAVHANRMLVVGSTLASEPSGSSPTPTAWSSGYPIHTLTTRLTRRYGTIVVEDLDIAAMARGMGRRAFRRSVHAAGLGQIRPTMAYKSAWRGCTLVVADRWFASSKIHHECGGYHPDLKLADRRWVCPRCGGLVDRNANAARNLRDWTGPVTDRDVQRGGVAARCRSWATTTDRLTQRRGCARPQKTTERWRRPMTPEPTHPGARNPAQGCQERSDTDAR